MISPFPHSPGLEALRHMADSSDAIYEFQGSQYRVETGVLVQRPVPLLQSSLTMHWSESKISPLEFLKETWIQVAPVNMREHIPKLRISLPETKP